MIASALNFRIRTRMALIGAINLLGFLLMIAAAAWLLRARMIDDRITMTHNLTQLGQRVLERQYQRAQRGEISVGRAQQEAIDELRLMRYAHNEYFFIDTDDGCSLLLPVRKELEGTCVLDLVDSAGRRYVREQRDVARRGGGTVRYAFTKPDTARPSEKLAYILPFAPWGWFIGTGIYLDDVEREFSRVLWRGMALWAAIALVTMLLIFRLSRGITLPLRQLTAVITMLTARRYQVAVPGQQRKDEIGDIARAIEVFKETGEKYMLLQQEIQRQQEQARTAREAVLALERDTAIRLEQTARLVSMGEMALSLAHELNQPLAAVNNYCKGCIHYLEQGNADTPALLAAMRKAADQALRAARIITRMRNFLRHSEPELSPQSLRDIVTDMADMVTIGLPEMRSQAMRIALEIPAGLPPVLADRTMIEQVVLNLLRNGIEAMAAAGPTQRLLTVKLSVDAQRRYVTTEIIDCGIGVEAADRPQLFTLFYTSKAQGMGVGLNICRTIVEYHQGEIAMRPNPQGGAIFTFTLPVAEA